MSTNLHNKHLLFTSFVVLATDAPVTPPVCSCGESLPIVVVLVSIIFIMHYIRKSQVCPRGSLVFLHMKGMEPPQRFEPCHMYFVEVCCPYAGVAVLVDINETNKPG